MEYTVYYPGPDPPSLSAWRRAIEQAEFPLALADDFSFEPEEGVADAKVNDHEFWFEFVIGDADASCPMEAVGARRVASFRVAGWNEQLEATVLLAATFAVASDGWLRSELSEEVFRGAEAIEYARWFATLPDDEGDHGTT